MADASPAPRSPRFYDLPDGTPVVAVPIENREGKVAIFDQDFYLGMLKRYGDGFRVTLNSRKKNGKPPEYVRIPEPHGAKWRVAKLQAAWIVLGLWPGDNMTVEHKDGERQHLWRNNLRKVPKHWQGRATAVFVSPEFE